LGFNNYEISNYWKPWFECKHNIWYWNHSEVLGFWLWAYWFTNNFRYANSDSFKDYYAWKINFKNKLTEDDIFLEKVMFQLRTWGLKEENYKKLNTKKINYFIKNNYMFFSLSSEGFKPLLKLSDSWILVMDYIISEII
jgi:oxygen-independent coproporphyrinogen-3 oxidase